MSSQKSEKPVRVTFVGAAGAGKSTQARLLQKQLGGDVLSFAAPIRKICRDLFGDKMDDPAFYRKAMQYIGTDLARALDSEVWLRQLTAKIPETRNTFVDDCRFLNEYYALKNRGFYFVRLTAPLMVLMERRPDMTAETLRHQSETENLTFHADLTLATDLFTPEAINEQVLAFLNYAPVPIQK